MTVERRQTMWAEMRPDCYGGKTCDQIEPRWHCYAEGDKDSDYQRAPLKLDARLFPPGTKVLIEEPVCPQCKEVRSPIYPAPKRGPLFTPKCRCGFDWETWTLHQYS